MIGQGIDDAEFDRFKNLVESIGARVLLTRPEAHDAAVALISHLPQLVSSALASLLGPERDFEIADRALARRLAATGWRDSPARSSRKMCPRRR